MQTPIFALSPFLPVSNTGLLHSPISFTDFQIHYTMKKQKSSPLPTFHPPHTEHPLLPITLQAYPARTIGLHRMARAALCLTLYAIPLIVFAQNHLTGHVSDEKGKRLANVIVKAYASGKDVVAL